MTHAQIKLYRGEWENVRAVVPDADDDFRYECHRRALGYDKSSAQFTNRELDLVLAHFRAMSRPADLAAQLAPAEQTRKRLLWSIKNKAPASYVRAIVQDRFAGRRLEDLADRELRQLIITLSHRNPAALAPAQ